MYFAGDDRFGALGVSRSATEYLPRWHGATPQLGDVQAMHDLVRRVEAGEPVAERLRRFDRAGGARLHALSAHVALRAAGQAQGYPELALLLRRRGPADAIEAQGEELFRRMVFNILIDNTDDHEKNHALVLDTAQRYWLAPAFDVLPSGQALGYQQMRVGRDGAVSTLANALSEHRSFAITRPRAEQVVAEVAQVVSGWQAHFKKAGVGRHDLALLAQQIDRPFLREQREAIRGLPQ